MNDEQLRREYLRARGANALGGHTRCPDPEALARVVNGDGSEAERLATLDHALTCARCRAELDLLRAASEGARAAERPSFPMRWMALAAAALLLIGIGTFTLRGHRAPVPTEDVMRGRAPAVSLVEPASGAAIAQPVQLRWRAVAGAASYRVELLSTRGDVISAWTTLDTVLAIPDSAHIHAGQSYDVWVRATLGDRTEVSSPIVRFSVK